MIMMAAPEDPEPEPASLRRCPAKLHRKIIRISAICGQGTAPSNCIGFGQMGLGKGKQTSSKNSGGKQRPRFSVRWRPDDRFPRSPPERPIGLAVYGRQYHPPRTDRRHRLQPVDASWFLGTQFILKPHRHIIATGKHLFARLGKPGFVTIHRWHSLMADQSNRRQHGKHQNQGRLFVQQRHTFS